MIDTPPLADARDRLTALRSYGILDTEPEPAFEAFVALAARTCDVPIAFIAFYDDGRQWLKASRGLPSGADLPCDATVAHAIRTGGALEIVDATRDVRHVDDALVAGSPHVRFFASIAIVDRAGFVLGALAVADVRPREADTGRRAILEKIAASLVVLVESRLGVDARTLTTLSLIGGAIEHAPDPIVILRRVGADERFAFTFANHAFAQLFGYDATTLIGLPTTILHGPLTDANEIERVRQTLRTASLASLVVAFYTARGARLTVELNVHRIDDAHWVMNVRDLTQIHETRDALLTSNRRLSSLLAHNADAVLTFERDGRCVDANPAAIALLGRSHAHLLESHLRDAAWLGTMGDGAMLLERLGRGETTRFETTLSASGGRAMVADCRAVPMIVHGVADGAYLIVRDVTEQRRIEALLERHARRARALYLLCTENAGDELARVDSALALVRESFAIDCAYVGRLDGERLVITNVVGEPFFAIGDAFPLVGTFVETTMRRGDVEAIEDLATMLARAPNSPLAVGWHGYIAAPLTVDGRPWGAVTFLARHAIAFDELDWDFVRFVAALVSSMLERSFQRQRLDRLAFYDALTDLPNRTSFLRELDETLARSARHDRSFALHYIDLDGFKAINDGCGHATGDLALREVARRLRDVTRPYDVPGRIGGDEFVLLQAEVASDHDVALVGERIVRELGEAYELDGRRETALGASVGYAIYPADGADATTLMKAADAALYRAKAAGKRRAERA